MTYEVNLDTTSRMISVFDIYHAVAPRNRLDNLSLAVSARRGWITVLYCSRNSHTVTHMLYENSTVQ